MLCARDLEIEGSMIFFLLQADKKTKIQAGIII